MQNQLPPKSLWDEHVLVVVAICCGLCEPIIVVPQAIAEHDRTMNILATMDGMKGANIHLQSIP